MALIYCATDTITGLQYVGMTKLSMEKRRKEHEYRARTNSGWCRYLNGALRKRGGAFVWRVVEDGLTIEEAKAAECAWILKLGTLAPGGYNLTTGGESPTFSDETLRRRSLARKGIPHSAAHRAALKAAQRRPEVRALKSLQATGRPKSLETRAKLSRAHTGRKNTEASKGAVSATKRKTSVAQAANMRMLMALGATQKDAAAWFGMSRQNAGRVLRGERRWALDLTNFYSSESSAGE